MKIANIQVHVCGYACLYCSFSIQKSLFLSRVPGRSRLPVRLRLGLGLESGFYKKWPIRHWHRDEISYFTADESC